MSASVSQSPDSVMAAASADSSVTDYSAAAVVAGGSSSTIIADNGGIQIQSTAPPLSQIAALPHFSITAPPMHPQQAKSNVKNPYLKQTPSSPVVLDASMKKRKQFIEKYRVQAALHHSHRRTRETTTRSISGVVGPTAAVSSSSVSALDLRRRTHQWRRSWRGELSCNNNSTNSEVLGDNNLGGMPLRPRLFLFRRHDGHADRQQQQQRQQPLQQQSQSQNYSSSMENRMQSEAERSMPQQHEGIWELGTGITELSGEGGSGKTQICLSLCVTCAMTPLLSFPRPSSDGSNSSTNATDTTTRLLSNQQQQQSHYTSIYITMGEGISSIRIAMRLEKMVRARLKIDDPNEIKQILSRIGLLSIRNEEEFVEFVEQDLPNLLEHHNNTDQQHHHGHHHHQQHPATTKIGLIAFDGIAGFFRYSDPLFQGRSRNSMFHFQRSSKLFQVSSQLRKLTDVYDVPILITNQVSASIPPIIIGSSSSSGSDNTLRFSSTPEQVVPALGLLWSNCVTTRYILQRKDGMVARVPDVGNGNRLNDGSESKSTTKQGGKKEMRVRKARVLQSVNMPEEREVWFVIDTGEVFAVA
ncbi:hypothetical protein ACHAXR_007128 [Thalassiosira sp. AJA248-18]